MGNAKWVSRVGTIPVEAHLSFALRSGGIRIVDSSGAVACIIPFNEADRKRGGVKRCLPTCRVFPQTSLYGNRRQIAVYF
jgi:hypothetical protein